MRDADTDEGRQFGDHRDQAGLGADRTAEAVGDDRTEGEGGGAFAAEAAGVGGGGELIVEAAVVSVRTEKGDESAAGEDDQGDVPAGNVVGPDHVLRGVHRGVDQCGRSARQGAPEERDGRWTHTSAPLCCAVRAHRCLADGGDG